MSRDAALAYWHSPGHAVFVAEDGGSVAGTYYLRANHLGGGAHVANCGYMTAADAQGRGIAAAMCGHSLAQARQRGFRAMQFNFVVSSNDRAVRLWQHLRIRHHRPAAAGLRPSPPRLRRRAGDAPRALSR